MNNNDERGPIKNESACNYGEEQYNAHILDGEEEDSELDKITRNLASLNEIVFETVCALGHHSDYDYQDLVQNTLRNHSWELGFSFRGESPNAEFFESQKQK